MKALVRLPLSAALALGLSACGGGAKLGGGREGAAQAVFQAAQVTGRQSSGQGLTAAGAPLSVESTVRCKHGGQATLKLDMSGTTTDPTSGSVRITHDVTFAACNEDGRNTYDGTLRSVTATAFSTGGGTVTHTVKGRLDISGAIDDFVDADISMHMSVDTASGDSAHVSMVLDGTITTSSERHTYAHEEFSFSTGELPRG